MGPQKKKKTTQPKQKTQQSPKIIHLCQGEKKKQQQTFGFRLLNVTICHVSLYSDSGSEIMAQVFVMKPIIYFYTKLVLP